LSEEIAATVARVRPTVVFDLDGCLVHSSPDIAAALNATLANRGLSFEVVEVERMIGDGLAALFDKAIAVRGIVLSAEERKAGFDDFYARYAAEPAVRSEARGWVVDVARALKSNGARIAICTNKVEPIANAILDRLALGDAYHAAVGHVAGRAKKPDPEPMRLAVDLAGGDMSRSVMVGDSAADLGAGRGAGMPVVLVTGGYGTDDVRSLGADFVAGDRDTLIRAILDAARGRSTVGAADSAGS
jgi:phosphoglycolate phosphatase